SATATRSPRSSRSSATTPRRSRSGASCCWPPTPTPTAPPTPPPWRRRSPRPRRATSAPSSTWPRCTCRPTTNRTRSQTTPALAQEIAASTPGYKRAQLNLAAVYLQADDYPNAISVYERLRAEGQLSEEAEYRNLAALYLNSDGGEANAISVLNEGLEKGALPADDYRTWALLAQAYYFTDQPQQAIEAYRKAAPLD